MLFAVFASGCSALVAPVIVGAGGAAVEAYWRGEHSGFVDGPFGQCERAVREVACRFKLETVRRRDSGASRIFHLRNFEGVPFRIRIEPLTGDSTRVAIRAGVWGDEVCSGKLLSEIRQSACGEVRR